MTLIEKQIESQSSFKKNSGGPKNKEQNFNRIVVVVIVREIKKECS